MVDITLLYRTRCNVNTAKEPAKQYLYAGHVHVGIQVKVADAAKAVDIQLTQLFKVLPKPK